MALAVNDGATWVPAAVPLTINPYPEVVLVEDGWYSYDYNGGSGTENVFYAAAETAGPVFSVDDSGWRIDTPEDPDSVLPLLRYQAWVLPGPMTSNGNPIDLRGVTVHFDLRGTALDLKGAHATFWVLNYDRGERWHYTGAFPTVTEGAWSTFELLIDETDTANWHNSWRANPGVPGDLDLSLAAAHSYGIGFVGFSAEPTGTLDMRRWAWVTMA